RLHGRPAASVGRECRGRARDRGARAMTRPTLGLAAAVLGLVIVAAGGGFFWGERRAAKRSAGAPPPASAPPAPAAMPKASQSPSEESVEVTLTPEAVARAGIKTAVVRHQAGSASITVPGTVTSNAYRETKATALVGGLVKHVSAARSPRDRPRAGSRGARWRDRDQPSDQPRAGGGRRPGTLRRRRSQYRVGDR